MFFCCSGYTSRFLCIAIDFAETASDGSSKPPEIALLCNKQKAPYCTVGTLYGLLTYTSSLCNGAASLVRILMPFVRTSHFDVYNERTKNTMVVAN